MLKWFKKYPVMIAAIYFIFYVLSFLLLEFSSRPGFLITCKLDSYIPFCEWFAPAYFLWFPMMPFTLILLLIKDRDAYYNLCRLMFTGMTVSLLVYAVFPNSINLREAMPRDNIFCDMVNIVRQADTSRNVCPSIHVASTLAMFIAVAKSGLQKNVKIITFIAAVLICLSTMFIKQHSIIDVMFGILLTAVLDLLFVLWDNRHNKKQSMAYAKGQRIR